MRFLGPSGIIIALLAMIIGFMLEGGHMGALLAPSAALIVIGGTFGATIVAYNADEILSIPKLVLTAINKELPQYHQAIEEIIMLSDKARREGLLQVDSQLEEIEDPFLKKGIQLVVDGTEPELVRNILETDMLFTHERHETGASIFDTAGGYSPTMGIIGTVMGLVHVLGSIEDPDSLAPAIAMAFAATLYGVGAANIIFLPIAARLRNVAKRELILRELQIEGVLALQSGYNPIIIREHLNSFLKHSITHSRSIEGEYYEQ